VFLAPHGARIACVRRGLRPRADPARDFAVEGASGWPAAIEALARALPEVAPRGAEVRTIVSNHFVRYALLPGIERLGADEEREALARHQFQTVHGERAAAWRVALAEHGARASGLAAALDAELVDALVATLTAAGHTPRAIAPLLAAAVNACRGEIGSDPAWIAVAEPGRLCVGCLDDRRWIDVRNARAPRGPEAELAVVLEQMRLTAGAAAGRVFFMSHDPIVSVPSVGAGWTVSTVQLAAESACAEREAA
jgi:hypothetical protein